MPQRLGFDDDDDFQSLTPIPFSTQTASRTKSVCKNASSISQGPPLKSCNRATKRRKRGQETFSGKENALSCEDKLLSSSDGEDFPDVEIRLGSDENCSLSYQSCRSIKKSETRRVTNLNDSSQLESRGVERYSLSFVESSLDGDGSICEEELVQWKQDVYCKDSHVFDAKESTHLDYEIVEKCSLGFEETSLGCDGIVNERMMEFGKEYLKCKQGYLCNSIESRLLNARENCIVGIGGGNLEEELEEFVPGTQLNELLELCIYDDQPPSNDRAASEFIQATSDEVNVDDLICCPLCGCDLSELNEEARSVHTNECLDNMETGNVNPQPETDLRDDNANKATCESLGDNHQEKVDVSPVLDWLHNLGLDKYTELFIQEEIDWVTLQCMTEEDLFSIGVTAFGPRKKILHALIEIKQGNLHLIELQKNGNTPSCLRKEKGNSAATPNVQGSAGSSDDADKLNSNKLITDYFPAPNVHRSLNTTSSAEQPVPERNSLKQSTCHASTSGSRRKSDSVKPNKKNGKLKDAPQWCGIPGTPFRVDAFRYLRRDCSYWFLTHFHIDHYQGLTKSFCNGKIYCSSVTAKLINLKIGIPFEKMEILPLNQMITIAGIEVICFDANHCPGSLIILFKPPNGKAVLHTGDFRFHEGMMSLPTLIPSPIHTLILDTTYCDPQYDFPKQEAAIQFVIEAIQAEDFNPKTLFLIGSYTIGKERLFLEVARALHKKVYVNAAKLRLLQCLGLKDEDLGWFTSNEHESQIHVVPMWTLASTKRLKQISSQYMRRFNLVVAFSPTGWTFGKGKNKSPGKRWKQGTLIRYEVPYSEHSSFTELKEFVKLISPTNIIPSVNNDGPESAAQMISLLSS